MLVLAVRTGLTLVTVITMKLLVQQLFAYSEIILVPLAGFLNSLSESNFKALQLKHRTYDFSILQAQCLCFDPYGQIKKGRQ